MKIIAALLVWTLAVITGSADPSPVSKADQMNALRKAVADAYAVYHSPNGESGKFYKILEANFPKMLLLAQAEPASQPTCDALVWIALNGSANRGSLFTNRLQSLDYLIKYHSTNSKVGPLCSFLGRYWPGRWREKSVVGFLEAVAKNNPDHGIRGQAIYGLGRIYAIKSEVLAEFENWGKSSFFTNKWTPSDITEFARSGSSQSAAAEADRQFKEVIANYADCLDLRERLDPKEDAPTLKKLADQELYDLLHLSLGKTAPEIVAEGVDGKKFKLSDSRGKICVLSFWASWCGPCMQMLPVERALVERLHGESFAMIGVNGDGNLGDAERAIEREKITWPSFWNGKDGAEGPISSTWNIRGWPTIFVLDANGVIRFKLEGYGSQSSSMLNGSVDELLKTLPIKKQ